MRNATLLAAALAAGLAGAAGADLTVDFVDFTAAGYEFDQLFAQGELTGTLTSVVIDAVLVQPGQNFTWASDLAVVVATDSLEGPYYLQVGGFNPITGVLEYTDGLNGFSSAAGTPVSYSYDLLTPLDVSDMAIWLGNGYAFGGDGVWTGSITLKGVTLVPAPGAIALLGFAGALGRRRRTA